ncbi:MAG: CHAT domain-containing protein [Acidobacteria bacterium]|nr:CHAT domain-containing protein [Acidobacteriota bacterium]
MAKRSSPELLSLAEIGRRTGIAYGALRRIVARYLDQLPHQGEGARRRYYLEALAVFERLALLEGVSLPRLDLLRRAKVLLEHAAVHGVTGKKFEEKYRALRPHLESLPKATRRQIARLKGDESFGVELSAPPPQPSGERGPGTFRGPSGGKGSRPGGASRRKTPLGPGGPGKRRKVAGSQEKTRGADRPETRGNEAPRGAPRYANAVLLDGGDGPAPSPSRSLASEQELRLRLDIGPWSAASQVRDPVAIDTQLPRRDLWLDLLVTSTHFGVRAAGSGAYGQVARGRFFLPADGGAATTPEGEPSLDVFLKAPVAPGRAFARIAFFYRGAVVQSLRLEADVGVERGGFRIVVDYSVSHSLADLEAIPERPRVSVVVNDNDAATHQLVLRGGVSGAERLEATSEIEVAALARQVGELRARLRALAPTRRRRTRDLLKRDLEELAPLGWKLHAGLWKSLPSLAREPDSFILHVARPSTSSFTFPWSLLYDIPLDHDKLMRREVKLCPVVETWRGGGPLMEPGQRRCPEEARISHRENILCPFGFWGYRYAIEQLSSAKSVGVEIPVPEDFRMVVGKTRRLQDRKALEGHIADLRALLQRRSPRAVLEEGEDKATLRTLLGSDLPLVYFYCHGDTLAGDPHTYLGIGNNETLAAEDFVGWLVSWDRQEHRKVWDRVRPLIFINACHSVELQPEMLLSYQDAFIGGADASGIIGTEVRINPDLALEFAGRFFELFLGERKTVDQALRQARFDFLADGNLFGLVYTPYCWADLQLAGP